MRDDPAVVVSPRHDGDRGEVAGAACRTGRLAQGGDVLGRARGGQRPARPVDGRHGHVEQARDLGGDLAEPTAGQHHLHQRAVRLLGADQHGGACLLRMSVSTWLRMSSKPTLLGSRISGKPSLSAWATISSGSSST
ncbi:hypothetical protein GCM10020219_076930 [Nonomuraea dietziae]